MIDFEDINFGQHHPDKPFDHPCPPPCPPFDPKLDLFHFIKHVDGVAHKALELAKSATLDAIAAKKLSEQTLKVLNKVSILADKANVKADRALAEIEIIKDELQALVDELDATQAGAGLDATGKYIKDPDTNYIKNATSLANADKLLDAALKEVDEKADGVQEQVDALKTAVTALQTKVRQIETIQGNIIGAVGLQADGNYQPGTHSYINTAGSVLEATDKLARKIEEVRGNVTSNTDAINGLTTTVNQHTTDITNLKNDVISLDGRLDAVETDLEIVDDRLDAVEGQAAANSADIDALQNQSRINTNAITDLRNEVVANTSNIRALQAEDVRLAGLIGTNTSNIGRNTNSINTINNTLSTLGTDVANHEGRLDAIEPLLDSTHTLAEQNSTDVNALEGRMDTAEGDIDALEANVSTLTSRVATNAASITSLQTSIGNISLTKTGALEYTLMVNGSPAGKVNIPEDQFLQQVHYDPSTKMLTFTFADGTTIQPIYLGDLIDEYTAGPGIEINGHQVAAKIDPASEKGLNASGTGFLSVGTTGLKINGIIDEIDRAYVAGPGLQRSNTRNPENEWVLSAKIEQNSADYLRATTDGLGINMPNVAENVGSNLAGDFLEFNNTTKKLDVKPAALAGDNIEYNPTTKKFNVTISPEDIVNYIINNDLLEQYIENIVNAKLLWQVRQSNSNVIEPIDGRSVYVNGTITATGEVYSGQ